MSVKGEISRARTEADLRFNAMADPNPQASYARTKLRTTGVALIVCSPLGLLFGGVGLVVMIVIGIILLIVAGLSKKAENRQLAEIQKASEKHIKDQQDKEAVDLEYKKLMIEKMKRENKNIGHRNP